jgi:hypothetical protein
MGVAGVRLGNIGVEFHLALLYLQQFAIHVVLAFPVLVVPVRNDPERCARGRLTYWGLLAGFGLGALANVFGLAEMASLSGRPMLGLLIGAVVGNVIGRFMGYRFKLQDERTRV